MINALTGNSVTSETLGVLSRLEKGESVPIAEINNLREIKEAFSCLSNSTPTIQLKNRKSIQKGVFNRLQNMGSAVTDSKGAVSFSGEILREKRLDIVIGLPASGKSSAVVEPLSGVFKSRVIDSDEAKKLLPEYNNGWGAGVVHDESVDIAARQFTAAVKNGENIVYPRVGGNCAEMKKVIGTAKENGYKVYVHYNELDRNKAIGRLIGRFLQTGRFIKPDLVSKYGNTIAATYNELKTDAHLIDGFSKWSNDVPNGARPRLIEYSGSCKELCKAIKATPQERAEITHANNIKLLEKLKEVNEILRQNPELSREYIMRRDEYRQGISKTADKSPPRKAKPVKR